MDSKTIVRVVASIVLVFLSVGAISLIDKLPYSHARDVLSDSLRLRAYLITTSEIVCTSGAVVKELAAEMDRRKPGTV